MRISDKSGCHFTITRIDTDPKSRGDINAKVSAAGFGFTGANKSVWFDRLEIDRFITELRALDVSREGSVTLETMSPGECVLTFRNYDMLGHIHVEVIIARPVHYFGETDYFRARLRFEVNAESPAFTRMIDELEAELAA